MKLAELKEGEIASMAVLITSVAMGVAKNRKEYATLSAMDQSGSVSVKVWEMDLVPPDLEAPVIVRVSGKCNVFNGEKQLIVNQPIEVLGEGYRIEDFVEASPYQYDSLLHRFNQLIESVRDPWLQKLLEYFFGESRQFREKFVSAPAAVRVHQNYLHGLLEHSVFVTRVASMMCGVYPWVNKDLVVTASLLHDVGKVHEILELPNLEYTEAGELLGHVSEGAFLVRSACESIPGFPEDLKNEIVHCVLAHSGKLEWGSPVIPKSPEAMVVHLADYTDSRLAMMRVALSDVEKGEWSARSKYLGGRIHQLASRETSND